MRRLEMLCCARTSTRIGRHAEKKHKEQDPEMRRQTSLSLLVQDFAFVLVLECICAYVCASVWTHA